MEWEGIENKIKRKLQLKKLKLYRTVYCQLRRDHREPSPISGHTLIHASMLGAQCLNTQGTRPGIQSLNGDSLVTISDQWHIVQCPKQIDWQISLTRHTLYTGHFTEIRRLITEGKWSDLRWNWKFILWST